MADGFGLTFKGLQEVDANLARLGDVAGERVMRSSLYVAMEPIERRTQLGLAAIPTGSGALSKATRRVYMRPGSRGNPSSGGSGTRFVMAVAPKVKDQVAVALANLRYKRKKPLRGVFWGHLLEWGHRLANGGRVAGRRIFTKAYEAGSLEAIAIFRREIGKRVNSALRRASRRPGSALFRPRG